VEKRVLGIGIVSALRNQSMSAFMTVQWVRAGGGSHKRLESMALASSKDSIFCSGLLA
jgi:hypothetical protein